MQNELPESLKKVIAENTKTSHSEYQIYAAVLAHITTLTPSQDVAASLMKWISASDPPKDSKPKNIRYHIGGDIIREAWFYEDERWHNSDNDHIIVPAFLHESIKAEWLKEY